MTQAQLQKLHTILGKLESLQNEVRDPRAKERLGDGKKELLRALNENER